MNLVCVSRWIAGKPLSGSWKASFRFCARIGTMNRCASQRRGPDRGSATRSLPGSWRGNTSKKLDVSWGHEPTPNPSGGGEPGTLDEFPSWEGPGVGRFWKGGETRPVKNFEKK